MVVRFPVPLPCPTRCKRSDASFHQFMSPPPPRCAAQEIAKKKMPDMNAVDLAGAMRMVEGTARSLGLTVVE